MRPYSASTQDDCRIGIIDCYTHDDLGAYQRKQTMRLDAKQGVVLNTTRKGPDKLVVQIVTVFVPIVTKYT